MNLDGWTWEEATLRPNAGIKFNFPVARRRRRPRRRRWRRGGGGGGATATTTSRSSATTAGWTSSRGCSHQARAYAKAGPDKAMDWSLDALVPVVEGTLPLVTNGHRAQEHPRRGGVRRSRQGEDRHQRRNRSEPRRAAAQGEERSGHPRQRADDCRPARTRSMRRRYQLAGELAKAGVKVAFSTGDAAYARACRSTRRCRSRGAWIATRRSRR